MPITFFSVAADEVARLVPVAAERTGWSAAPPLRRGEDRWEVEVRGGDGRAPVAAVTIEARTTLWTAVRFSWHDGSTIPCRERERFARMLAALSHTPELRQ